MSKTIPETSARLPTRDVAARYSVTTRSIDRWRKNPDLAFPQPIHINDRKYWSLADLEKWERERTRIRVGDNPSLAGKPPAGCIANRRGQS